MNFTQLHERLRLEIQRRIQRGTASVSLLARQTGYGQSHLSNFLNSKRQLSLQALDRVLASQHLSAADLLPSSAAASSRPRADAALVPLVSYSTAMYEPFIRPTSSQRMLHVPATILHSARARSSPARHAWQRFVLISADAADTAAMAPLLAPDALVLLDRHYSSLHTYRLDRPTLYAVRHDARLKLRYAEFQMDRVVLRPHNRSSPVDLIHLGPQETPHDLIIGRVVLILNEY